MYPRTVPGSIILSRICWMGTAQVENPEIWDPFVVLWKQSAERSRLCIKDGQEAWYVSSEQPSRG